MKIKLNKLIKSFDTRKKLYNFFVQIVDFLKSFLVLFKKWKFWIKLFGQNVTEMLNIGKVLCKDFKIQIDLFIILDWKQKCVSNLSKNIYISFIKIIIYLFNKVLFFCRVFNKL